MKPRLGLFLAALAVAAALWSPAPVHAAVGDHISGADFDLTSGNDAALGIVKGETYIYVLDLTDQRAYAYTTTGTYTPSANITRTFASGLRPEGLGYDGTYYLWVYRRTDGLQNRAGVVATTAAGTHISARAFLLDPANDHASGVVWDGAYVRVADQGDDQVYTYTNTGTYTSAQDFDFASTINPETTNGDAKGITWDGTYYWVVDSQDRKVYCYDSSGNSVSSNTFSLATGNDNAQGITWDGDYLRVVDSTDDKVYTYEGASTSATPSENYGLADDVEFAAAVSSEVVAYDDWKCIRKTTAQTVTINSTSLDIHGFCAQPSGTDGMEVEIHLSVDTTYAELVQFANVTGNWWVVEEGAPATFDQRIYDDHFATTTDTGTQVSFTEEDEDYLPSDRLQFDTMAKSVTDDDCSESDGVGFACNQSFLGSLSAGDDAVLLFSLSRENRFEFADTPGTPDSVSVTRNAAYTVATVRWDLFDAVTIYQVERLTAVQVDVGASSRIEYGDPVVFSIPGTQAGIDQYIDQTIEAHRTYQYRVRARGSGVTAWSAWSEYVFSGARPEVDLLAPRNIQLTRDDSSVTVSWTAPTGDFDGITIQRQELTVVEGSTFFANIVTLSPSDAPWLPSTSTMHTDTAIDGAQTYEYRLAAVKDDQVGVYSGWFRVSPANTSMGDPPRNFRSLTTGHRVTAERQEFWMAWDDVAGAEDYEVQVLAHDLATGGQSTETHVVTDPTYFQTAYGTVSLRVRARKRDVVTCGASDDGLCRTSWTGWWRVPFIPKAAVEVPAPDLPDDAEDESIREFRQSTEAAIAAVFDVVQIPANPGLLLEFIVLLFGLLVAAASVALTWRRGMAPLGVGMGAAILILIFFAGYRLLGTSVAWPVGAQVLVAAGGIVAVVRQTGVWR